MYHKDFESSRQWFYHVPEQCNTKEIRKRTHVVVICSWLICDPKDMQWGNAYQIGLIFFLSLTASRPKRCASEQLKKNFGWYNMFLTSIKCRKCEIKKLKGGHMHRNMFLISIRSKKHVIKQLKGDHVPWYIFLIIIRPRECMIKQLEWVHMH